jgi:hypothetical protein
MNVPISDDGLRLPEPFTEPPDNVFALAGHVGLDPGFVRNRLRAIGVEPLRLAELAAAHLSSFHEAASGSNAERFEAVLSAWPDFTGEPIEELEDPDEPTGELQIEEICEKHGFDLDEFLSDISYYGFFHLACPQCGSVSLRQVQYDRVDETECRHRLQYAYMVMPEREVLIEYIPDEVGSDADPPEVGIECRHCGSRHHQGDLVIARQAHRDGYPDPDPAVLGRLSERPSPAETFELGEFVERLKGLRGQALELRDAIGRLRQAAPVDRFALMAGDDEEAWQLLWGIEEHVDSAAADIDLFLRTFDLD